MRQSTTRLYNWAMEKAGSEKAPFWIALLFFLELSYLFPSTQSLCFSVCKIGKIFFFMLRLQPLPQL